MSELKGQDGELRFTVEVKRAATGKVETYDLIGKLGNGRNPLDSGKRRRD